MSSFIRWLPLYTDLIIVCDHLSKMKNFMFLKPSQTPHFRFIMGNHPAWSIGLSLYNEKITIQTLLHKNTWFSHFKCRNQSSYLIFKPLKIQANHCLWILRSKSSQESWQDWRRNNFFSLLCPWRFCLFTSRLRSIICTPLTFPRCVPTAHGCVLPSPSALQTTQHPFSALYPPCVDIALHCFFPQDNARSLRSFTQTKCSLLNFKLISISPRGTRTGFHNEYL